MSFYLIDKEKNITSNKTLKSFMKEKNIKKAGFSGVLDPFATGLLIIATDGDTKFIERFLKSDKTYIGEILFGKQTDTLDIDGKIIKEKKVEINIKKLEDIIKSKFIGKIMQTPPNFSNIKVNGVRAHKLSRKNIDFNLKEVEREVKTFKILHFEKNILKFETTVSSGTYIRSLARDIGIEVDSPSMLISLRRTSIGNIKLEDGNITRIDRDDIIGIKRIDISLKDMKDLMDGKEIFLDLSKEEYIAYGNKKVIWINKIDEKKYKIKKRIE